jgi:hypothetical protein
MKTTSERPPTEAALPLVSLAGPDLCARTGAVHHGATQLAHGNLLLRRQLAPLVPKELALPDGKFGAGKQWVAHRATMPQRPVGCTITD